MNRIMSVNKRLAIGFGIAITISILLGLIALFSLYNVDSTTRLVIRKDLPFVQELLNVRIYFTRIDSMGNALLSLSITPKERQEKMNQFEEDKKIIDKLFESIDGLEKREEQRRLWEEFKGHFSNWWKDHEVYVGLVSEFNQLNVQNPSALRSDIRQFMADHYRLCSQVRSCILFGTLFEGGEDHTQCNFGKWLAQFHSDNNDIINALDIVKPLHQNFHGYIKQIKSLVASGNKEEAIQTLEPLQDTMRKIFEGFNTILNVADRADEKYSAMSHQALVTNYVNYSKARDTLEKLVAAVQKEAEYDGNRSIQVSSWAMFIYTLTLVIGTIIIVAVALLTSRYLSKVLREIIQHLREGANQVSSASEQVAQASQSLASSASSQASSNEETSASLEELTSMVQQNAANASQAEQMMLEAKQIVERCMSSMQVLIQEMTELRQASANTAGIIKTIDEIAFQTNLLALNAAVEAARAGEAGKGFAVVAEEVRRLAQRSAEAAKNTQRMLEEAIQRSERSANETQVVSENLAKVQESAEKMYVLVQEISTASNEQAKGVEQINLAMMEINKATQEVAANSEESASASQEMSAQAKELLSLVRQLEMLVGIVEDAHQRMSEQVSGGGRKLSGAGHSVGRVVPDRRQSRAKALPSASGKDTGTAVVSPEQVIPLDDEDLKNF